MVPDPMTAISTISAYSRCSSSHSNTHLIVWTVKIVDNGGSGRKPPMGRGACKVNGADLEQIELSAEGNMATVRLNRPDRYNALGSRIVDELGQALERVEGSEQVRAVILTGAGEK